MSLLITLITSIVEGFLLGTSIGAYCVGFCLPVLAPHIMIGHRGIRSSFRASLFFCFGRLIAYVPLGLLLGLVGSVLLEKMLPTYSAIGLGLLGFFVLIYGAFAFTGGDIVKRFLPRFCSFLEGVKSSFILGFVAALIPCFPLVTVVIKALIEASVLRSIVLLTSFWSGTSIYLISVGILSGKVGDSLELRIGLERVRRICGFSMIMVGLLFLVESFYFNL